VSGALPCSVHKQQESFWKMRVAQADMARRAAENFKAERA
ncbi:hypothetical protein A2U01_0070298, partial [Trifolium medium]|nr:hypothetical protein [Trifolium medium]